MSEEITIDVTEIKDYLASIYNGEVNILYVGEIGKEESRGEDIKGFGYGTPILIEFLLNGERRRVVLETIKPGAFGHEHFSDRAQIILWQYSAFNNLPRHVHAIDAGAFTHDGRLKSISDCKEFFILTELAEGQPYYLDLERIKRERRMKDLDLKRCISLSEYIASIHTVKNRNGRNLYIRRIRELLGHGECIMGLTDSYPLNSQYVNEEFLKTIEKRCIDWRWKLKKKTYRCSQVHGDFHPWNILFKERCNFTVLDRSRGEWGEPADDITAMSINYLFYSLQTYNEIRGPFLELFQNFWETYLKRTGDEEVLTTIQPFYAWRGLVIASPIWYPNLKPQTRRKIFNFIKNILETDKLNLQEINEYFKD